MKQEPRGGVRKLDAATTVITAKISHEQGLALQQRARATDRTISGMVRHALRCYLESATE